MNTQGFLNSNPFHNGLNHITLNNIIFLTSFLFGVILGQYVYVESSYPRKQGDRADLRSQQFGPTTPRCLNFWFNAHGANMGALRVLISPFNSTNSSTKIWQVSQRDFGLAWVNGRVTFSSKIPFFVSDRFI